jgi:hypothetical protein
LKDIAKGIQPQSGGGGCLTDIQTLSNILETIQQFYERSGEASKLPNKTKL